MINVPVSWIVEALKAAVPASGMDSKWSAGNEDAINYIANYIGAEIKKYNPYFDFDLFLKECLNDTAETDD